MTERLLITVVLAIAMLAAIRLGRAWYAHRNRTIEAKLRHGTSSSPATPRIVYFTTSTCVVCRAQQEPAIQAVRDYLPQIVVERHDAVADRQVADRYGVLTVPTTAVYDASGELVTVNRGFAPAAVLLAQLRGDEPSFEGGAAMHSEPIA